MRLRQLPLLQASCQTKGTRDRSCKRLYGNRLCRAGNSCGIIRTNESHDDVTCRGTRVTQRVNIEETYYLLMGYSHLVELVTRSIPMSRQCWIMVNQS